ncbi:MAG: TIGR03000 domain-containing protein [Gemmataceae bacterium]|nr:TIGR03000 domain-containing protein [Gemmataceae bacterium]
MLRSLVSLALVAALLAHTQAVQPANAEKAQPDQAQPGKSQPAKTQNASATIVLNVPADAAVAIEGTKTESSGARRTFISPPLEPGRSYSYTLTLTWKGKSVTRRIVFEPGKTASLTVAVADFGGGKAGPAIVKTGGIKTGPLPARPGFVLKEDDGRWWVFRAGSKELMEAEKSGFSEKHVTRINVQPWKVTLKAPDWATLIGYVAVQDGFETIVEDGRLWVFRKGAKELAAFKKDGELAKHVILVNAGPLGVTLKAPDRATIDAYLTALSK